MTQDRALQDKVVLMTGGARGIGASGALALANRGAYLHVTDVLDCGETVKSIQDEGGQAEAHKLDITDRAACQALADAIRAQHGHLDILVCNAGVCPEGSVAGDWEQWERVIDINLHGTQNCIAAVYDGMKETGFGRIVIVSSMAYYQGGLIVGSEYSASKAAVIGLTRHIARNAGQYGINVNAIAPGVIETDMTANFDKPEFDLIPVRRYGTAEDVAGPISFLCGPESAFMTGTVLNVTGGQVIAA